MYILETPRFLLRETTPDDAEQAYLLNADEEVIRYTSDKAFDSIEQARTFLSNYDHFKNYGFGRWAVIEKNSMAFCGWCGLKYNSDKNEFDIGFRFFKKYWNMGYATETAAACIKLGFEKFGMQEIVGRAMVKNKASVRVLEKIGLVYDRDFDFDGEPGLIYKIKNQKHDN